MESFVDFCWVGGVPFVQEVSSEPTLPQEAEKHWNHTLDLQILKA